METRKVSELKANPLNPRGEVVVDDALRELAASIRVHGVLQPILITPDGTIVAGHRRVKASEIAKAESVPVIIRELDETAQIQVMLIENLQRANLTALQTARAYKTLVDRGLSIRQISMAIGYRPESISRHLSILELPKDLHSAFDGEYGIPLGGIQYLLELDEPMRLEMGQRCKEKGWSIEKLRRKVEALKPKLRNIRRSLLERVWDRVQDGCYTAETIAECGECGGRVLPELTFEDIHAYLEQLVKDGRAEFRKQGGKKDDQRGQPIMLCVPADLPTGSIDFSGRDKLSKGNERVH